MRLARRSLFGTALAMPFIGRAGAQGHAHHGDLFHSLRSPGAVPLPPQTAVQWVTDSPAPAGPPGRWEARAPLPLPRSEMAWGVALRGRVHIVGGYGEQRVDRNYHHAYDPAADRWIELAVLPRGANHVGVVADDAGGVIYALGGFVEQNRTPHGDCFVWEIETNRWRTIAPLPRPRGAGAAVMLDGMVHHIGGAGDGADRASVGWHEIYDPKADRWQVARPLPGARDHTGTVTFNGLIHVIGGRFNDFGQNTALHHVYDKAADRWSLRAPLPTMRSGQGAAVVGDRIYVMGGEGGTPGLPGGPTGNVFGQMESYHPASDTWQHHAPMPTPRHGLGAAAVDGRIYVAGGGPIVGGGVQSAVHEVFIPA